MQDEADLQLAVADDKLVAAQLLVDRGFIMDAPSLTYYAMFHAGQALLAASDITTKTHRGFLNQLRLHWSGPSGLSVQELKRIVTVMEARESADYEAFFQPNPDEVRVWLVWARQTVDKVRSILGKPRG